MLKDENIFILTVTDVVHIPLSVLQRSQSMCDAGYERQSFWMGFTFANLPPTNGAPAMTKQALLTLVFPGPFQAPQASLLRT